MPPVSIFYELQSVMRSILFDLDFVDKKVNDLEMRFNPKPLLTERTKEVALQTQPTPMPP